MSAWHDGRQRSEGHAPLITPVRSFGADGTLHMLQGLGGDIEALCREAGIDHVRLRDPDYRVEAHLLLKALSVAAARTGDASVGLHAAQHVRFGSLASHLIASQNTVADALSASNRTQLLSLGAEAVAVHSRGDMVYVMLDTGPDPELARHLTEYCVASTCRLLGWITLQAARPSEVHFRHRCGGSLAEYEAFFGCRVEFDATESGASLSRATLAQRLVCANEELAAELELLVRSEIERQPPLAFRDRVTLALRAGRMRAESCRREVIASRLGVSNRTLQRRLEDEGTTFSDVLDDTRRQAALEMIADPAISIADIGYSIGYADAYAFNKAFRRWTGRSPSAYRREESGHTAASEQTSGPALR